ncbi:MAG: hypothetical protein DHS20C10_11310 [marine bacterium B5-7]|nr:MAG: hypothetical protein DHS20C10_11310 [marine bacterium B5-7]
MKTQIQENCLQLSGDLDFSTVSTLLAEGEALIRSAAVSAVDLTQVTASNSAALALLLAWLRVAKQHSHRLHFKGMPQQLCDMASLYGVKFLLEEEKNNG